MILALKMTYLCCCIWMVISLISLNLVPLILSIVITQNNSIKFIFMQNIYNSYNKKFNK